MATRTVNPDYDSVNNAINGVVSGGVSTYGTPLVDGDTCIWLAGAPAPWPSILNINANILIQGAGADLTLAVPSSSTATIIVGGDASGKILDFTTNDTDHGGGDYKTARLTGVVFDQGIIAPSAGAVRFDGNSHMHLVSGVVKGGFRVDHCRWRAHATETSQTSGLLVNGNHYKITTYVAGDAFTGVGAASNATGVCFIATGTTPLNWTHGSTLTDITATDSIASASYYFATGGHLSGTFDHNYVDYNPSSRGSETSNFSRPTNADGVSVPNIKGQDDWGHPYIFGGGLANNGLYDAIYVEDNIFHKNGGGLATLDGGGNIVFRYNSLWGNCSVHGNESGNNMGTRATECYNNHFLSGAAITQPTFTPGFVNLIMRGGAWVAFNNRFSLTKTPFGILVYRVTASAVSGVMGLGDGTNSCDINVRDNPALFNGQSIVPVSSPADSRLGYIYLTGTIASFTGGVGSSMTISATITGIGADYPTGTFVNFSLRDLVNGGDGSDFSQGLNYPASRNLSAGLISSDTRVDATHRTFVVNGAANGNLTSGIGAGHGFEVRRVQTPFGVPGSGQIGNGWTMNGGDNKNSVQFKFQSGGVDVAGNNPRWCSQELFGLWQWDNQLQSSVGGAWSAAPDLAGVNSLFVAGGVHNWNGAGASSGKIPSGYPISSNPLRVGADWEAPGWSEAIAGTDDSHPIAAYGGNYPNPLAQAPATKVVGLTIDNSGDFGNVIVGNSSPLTLRITNTGSAALTVSSITYPSGYSGAFSGTIAANGGFQDVVVTFSPVAVQTYSGNITVNSDATSGTNTIAVTGNGVSASVNAPTAPRGLTIVRE